ncbi:zinc finger BED domain-containing 4-like, partial [Brachionus plicatilis]
CSLFTIVFIRNPFLNNSGINPNWDIGTNTIPRYSCAAHKINLMRILRLLAKLSKYAASVRTSTIISYDFTEKKAKLRCEIGTRWSSSYLMLQSFYKAYEKSAFPTDKQCPVRKTKIVSYFKILRPLYSFSLLAQKSDWHIGDVIPGLIIFQSSLSEFQETGEKTKLIDKLISQLKERFQFELESQFYLLATILNTSKLNYWFEQPYAREYSDKIIFNFSETVSQIYQKYINAEDQTQTVNPVNQRKSVPIHNTENSVLRSFLNSVSYESKAERNSSSGLAKINREKEMFLNFIREPTSQQKSTKEFLNENSYRFRILSQIARILFSIPASSAFVERFFSICGIVSSKRSQHIHPQNFMSKTLLKLKKK